MYTLSEAKKFGCPLVYGLCDLNGAIFYVGKTVSAVRRFQDYRECRNASAELCEQILRLGPAVRVVILALNPNDLGLTECEEIRHRECALVNKMRYKEFRVTPPSAKPWNAGPGLMCPSSRVLARMDADDPRRLVIKGIRAKMSDPVRCLFEMETYLFDLNGPMRRRMEKWFDAVIPKILPILLVPFEQP